MTQPQLTVPRRWRVKTAGGSFAVTSPRGTHVATESTLARACTYAAMMASVDRLLAVAVLTDIVTTRRHLRRNGVGIPAAGDR